MSVQAALNSGNPNQLGDAAQATQLGNLLAYAISKMTATESGVTVTTNTTAPIANQPVALLQVVGITSGAARSVKKLRKGPVSGAGALVPAAGEVIWDGGTHLLFAAADLAATCDLTYTVATDKASILLADLSAGGGA
jgi:hypothetical protein